MEKKKLILIIILLIIIEIVFNIKSNNSKTKKELKEETEKIVTKYESKLFDNSYVHDINIIIKDEDWQDLQDNPLDKTKYRIDVEIDGELYKDVSFSTKGNSSLNKVAEGPKTYRYSFKINFGKYKDNQNYYGLNKLHLNNIYADATYLKDYVSYELFRELNVPSPLTSYTFIKVNNQDIGLYLAVEEVDETFLSRNNINKKGNLYKPLQYINGANLKYINDDITNYPDIFDNAENNVKAEDKTRLIASLEKLSNNEKLNKILNTDEVIRYFVVHNFLLNYDSYTGKSVNNYFLYEKNGKIQILPWDYNLSFGAMGFTQNDTYIINYGIDSPLVNSDEEDRPLWKWIIKNPKYLDIYHDYMDTLISNQILNNKYDKIITEKYNIIKPYIDKDPSKFYNANQIATATDMLKTFIFLRAKSIKAQLNGELATKTDEQIEANKIEATNIQVDKMGLKIGNQ